MTEMQLVELLQQGHETVAVEFKSSGMRSDARLFAKVTRAALAMANRRGGGQIIIGVREELGSLRADGLSQEELSSWTYDNVSAGISSYAEPHVDTTVETVVHDGKYFVVISVSEFEETPVLCKKDYQGILRAGGCYVRRRGRTESVEVPNHSEMRALLDLAVEKGLRRFLQIARRGGVEIEAFGGPSSSDLYAKELESFE